MIRARSFAEAPRAISDRTNRSMDTEGSPASILATRDWLDRTALANSTCVSRRLRRRCFRPSASFNRSSMYASSSAVSPRNSLVPRTLHPFASNRFRFSSRTVVLPKTPSTSIDHRVRRALCLLAEYLCDLHGVGVQPIHDSPSGPGVSDPQFMTSRPYRRHRSRVRHSNALARLQPPQQVARLDPGLKRKRWRLHLAMQPNQGPV